MTARSLKERKQILNLIYKERNKHVTRERAILIVCKRRGWDVDEITELLKRKPRSDRKPDEQFDRCAYEAKRRVALQQCVDAWKRPREEQQALVESLVAKLGLTATQVWCYIRQQKPRDADPTPEEIAAECASIRKYGVPSRDGKPSKGPRRVHETAPPPVEMRTVHNLGVLSGRAGSWWASE